MDPLEMRLKTPYAGQPDPHRGRIHESLIGNLAECLNRVRAFPNGRGKAVKIKEHTVRAKGVACLWKTQPSRRRGLRRPYYLQPRRQRESEHRRGGDGLGGKTNLAQILAEKLKIDPGMVHVVMDVDTRTAPEHWKTAASLTEYMVGRAVMKAADDLIEQPGKTAPRPWAARRRR